MELPDIKERQAIMKIHTKKIPLSNAVNLRNIAERTPGFSGADLANLVNEAAILAARRNKPQVVQNHLEESIEKVILGPEKKSKVFSAKEKKVTAYHEAGHAVVTYYTPDSDPVRKISIVSRGHAGGYTLKLPEEDKRLHTKTGFLSELATLMGGYTSELIKFKELTTGASDDLRKATNLARRIVTDFGMSALGPMTFGQKEEYVFLGKELHEARNYSEETAAKIDEQISKILNTAHIKAKEILTKHNDKLELVAKTLIAKETINQAEFKKMMSEDYQPDAQVASAAPETTKSSTDKTTDKPTGKTSPAPAPAT
jgi:cell division protease FtsH